QHELQQESLQLLHKHWGRPLAGCLPIFVQMPILIALHHAIIRTPEVQEHTFLWFQLGTSDYILPLIAGGATFIQQKMMMGGSQAAQNPQMMVMLYVMPIMIIVMGYILPAALALYWVVGNVFMIAQTVFIRKPMMDNQKTGGDKK